MPTLILATGNPHKVDELRAIFAALGTGAGSTGAAVPITVLGLNDLPHHDGLHEPAEPGATCEENARIKALSYAAQICRQREIEASRQQGEGRSASSSLPSMPGCLNASMPAPPLLILADDSGIEIDALRLPNGTPRPGVISSHYSTDGRETGVSREQRDAANNARVLRELDGFAEQDRAARFVCCMCLVRVGLPGGPPLRGGSAALFRPSPDTPLNPMPTEDRRGAAGHPIPGLLHESRGTMDGRIGIPPRVPAGTNGFGYDPLFLVGASPFNSTKTGAELSSAEKNALSHRGMAARAMAAWIMATMK